jgi:hypothetical protein
MINDGKEWELDQVIQRTIPALEKLINDESIKDHWDFY